MATLEELEEMGEFDDMPQRPSQEEASLYYHGLPSSPRLIARSGRDKFVGPKSRWDDRHRKWLARVGDHAIAGLWHSGLLMQDVIRILSIRDIRWTAVDILRLGRNPEAEETEETVTMLISVEPGSTPWVNSQVAVNDCKDRLKELRILDVEVEMKEAVVITTAPPGLPSPIHVDTDPSQQMPPKLAADVDPSGYPMEFHLTEFLGTSISSADQDVNSHGTKGLYLRSRSTGQVYALTSRHAIYGTTRHPDPPRVDVIQPSDEALRTLSSMRYEGDPLPPLARLGVADRVIGSAVCAPKPAPHTKVDGQGSKRTPGFLCDWALVALDQSKFTTPLDQLTSRVYTGAEFGREVNGVTREERARPGADVRTLPLMCRREGLDGYTMRLQGLMRESGLVVMKQGAGTGFTVGVVNELVSMRNRGVEGACVDWAVITERDACRPFSGYGDSGACVFDTDGRVGGMITGGSGRDGRVDVTYFTPLCRLLGEIQRHGYDVDMA